jgi:Protein of unknown function (DUF2500)
MEFFFLLLGLFFVGLIIYALIEFISNASSPELSREAHVIGKRQHVSSSSISDNNSTSTTYYVTFELSDCSRIELNVHARAYGLLIEGDVGILRSQGAWFKGFDRQLDQQ